MKVSITEFQLAEIFRKWDRDYYSVDGYAALLDYYDGIDPDMELDVIGICGDCTEYGEAGAACDFDCLIDDYGYLLPADEWREKMSIAPEEWEENKADYIQELADVLENYTTVLRLDNGNYIVFAF